MGGEKVNWGNKAINFKHSLHSVTGDVLLSSGIIAYLGVFMIGFRDSCISKWKSLLTEKNIEFSQNFNLQEVLSDANSIGVWVN